MLRATLNEPVPLQAFATDGNEDLFVRVRLYNAAGTVVAALNPAHVANGLYSVNWTPATEGYYTAVYDFFTDSSLEQASLDHERAAEQVEVSSDKTNILRLLGLAHENAILDQQVYDGNRRLVSARLRAYDSKANAQAGGTQGLLFQWTVGAAYDDQARASLFKIERAG